MPSALATTPLLVLGPRGGEAGAPGRFQATAGHTLREHAIDRQRLGEAFGEMRGRGRDAGYPAPPAQIPACGATAPGSGLGSGRTVGARERAAGGGGPGATGVPAGTAAAR